MMNTLDITKTAVKFLEKLPPKQFRQIVRTIFNLREVPEPQDSKQLVGHP
jgi:mRNA-degrading endonuclease RelE of RelBE toxin-antitoxin system